MKTRKKLPSVTIAVSAFNEEANIARFLTSVLSQKEEGFVINEIWVYSDGSTDKTVTAAKQLKSSKVKIIADKKRIGKSSRLNMIYASLKSDILVQSDADVIMAHKYVIRDLISPLLREKEVGMSGGHPTPVKGKTFVEKAVNCTFEAYAPLRKKLRGGNNIFSVDGRILAYKKALVKKITVPTDTIANDAYTFFCCITKGYAYRYVPSAVVLFRSPQTLTDQMRQNTRFTAAPLRMRKLFPRHIVTREYHIPKQVLLWHMLQQFIKHPILCSYIYIINLICKMNAKKAEAFLNAVWPMAVTTKKLVKQAATPLRVLVSLPMLENML